MGKGKLILICQSGGTFITNDDGSLSYTGGEAEAIDINHETVFDDLKFKLAEIWDLDYTSLSIKYFLPGNRRTLINLSNDRDLKRMYDFHGESVTADVFVTGRKGFDQVAFDMHHNRYKPSPLIFKYDLLSAKRAALPACLMLHISKNLCGYYFDKDCCSTSCFKDKFHSCCVSFGHDCIAGSCSSLPMSNMAMSFGNFLFHSGLS